MKNKKLLFGSKYLREDGTSSDRAQGLDKKVRLAVIKPEAQACKSPII